VEACIYIYIAYLLIYILPFIGNPEKVFLSAVKWLYLGQIGMREGIEKAKE
jgi:hypothetical protein